MRRLTKLRFIACTACIAALCLLAAACGVKPAAHESAAPAAPQAPAETSAAAEGRTDTPASPDVSPEPQPSEEPAPTPDDVAEPEQQQPTYRMTKAFRIVPIDKEKSPDKVVLLTFDDGPKASETLDPILDALDKHSAKAIFFVNGYRVKANPALLKQIDDRGHAIGNHAYDHIALGKEEEVAIREQIVSVQTIVEETIGTTPLFFRPPFASSNDHVKRIAAENGLLYMTWSNGSLDWDLGKQVKDRPQAVIDHVMSQLHPGSNILMHELPWTAEALDDLLTQLADRGYGFVDPAAIDLTPPGDD